MWLWVSLIIVLYIEESWCSSPSSHQPWLELLGNTESLSTSLIYDITTSPRNTSVYILSAHSVWELSIRTDPAEKLLIAGSEKRAYKEGVGRDAGFYFPCSIKLRNASHAIITDMYNHCLRQVNLITGSTSRFAAECTNEGFRDGAKLVSHTSYPCGLTIAGDRVYFTDHGNDAVRMVSGDQVSTLVMGSPLNKPSCLDRLGNMLYITVNHGVVSLNLLDSSLNLVSGSPFDYNNQDDDESLRNNTFNYPHAILALTDTILLVADSLNNKLRIIDLTTNEISSICTGEEKYHFGGRDVCSIHSPRALTIYNDAVLVTGEDKILKLTGLADITGFLLEDCPDNIVVDIEPNQREAEISWTEPRVTAPTPESLSCDHTPSNGTFKPGVHHIKYTCYYYQLMQTCQFDITVREKCPDDINMEISTKDGVTPLVLKEPGLDMTVYSGLFTLHRNLSSGFTCIQTVNVREVDEPRCPDDISLELPNEVDRIAFLLPRVDVPVNWFCTNCPENVQILATGYHQFLFNYIKLDDITYTVSCNLSVHISSNENISLSKKSVPMLPTDKQKSSENLFKCKPLVVSLGVICLLLVILIVVLWFIKRQPKHCRKSARSELDKFTAQGQLFSPTDTSKAFSASSYNYLDRNLYPMPDLDAILNGRPKSSRDSERSLHISVDKPNFTPNQSSRYRARRPSIVNPAYEDPEETDEEADKVDDFLGFSDQRSLVSRNGRRGSFPH